jgi:hypothetical protein
MDGVQISIRLAAVMSARGPSSTLRSGDEQKALQVVEYDGMYHPRRGRGVHAVRPRMNHCERLCHRVATISAKMAMQFVHLFPAGFKLGVNCQHAILVRATSQCSSVRSA